MVDSELPSLDRRAVLALLGGAFAGCTAPSASPSASSNASSSVDDSVDWPVANGNAANTRYSPTESGPGTDLEMAWEHSLGYDTLTGPTVAGGTAYAGAGTSVDAVDTETGDRQWSTPLDLSVATFSPLVTADRVYVGGTSSERTALYSLDRTTGERIWSRDRNVVPSPTVWDGTVYFAENVDDRGRVRGIDESGEIGWEFVVPAGERNLIEAMPAIVDGTVYVTANIPTGGDRTTFVYAVDIGASEPLWSFQAPGRSVTAPTVAHGMVYVANNAGQIHALDAASGEERWAFDTVSTISDSPSVAEETVYAVDAQGNCYALDASSGQQHWHVETDMSPTNPAVADGTLYFGSTPFVAMDASDGSIQWQFTKSTYFWTMYPAAVVDDAVYATICIKESAAALYDNYLYKFV